MAKTPKPLPVMNARELYQALGEDTTDDTRIFIETPSGEKVEISHVSVDYTVTPFEFFIVGRESETPAQSNIDHSSPIDE